MNESFLVIADAFAYPGPAAAGRLVEAVDRLGGGVALRALDRFARRVTALPLADWEELHTRTVDLSPLFVPYVGHVVWGENYRRGVFMADLQRRQRDLGVDQGGELPDHLVGILRLLATDHDPPADLIEVLPGAVAAMHGDLAKAEPDNPYVDLLTAVVAAVDDHLREGASA